MNIQNFLKNLLEGAGEYALTNNDVEIIYKKGIQEYILAKLYSKKFRKWHLDDKCKKMVESEVDSALSNGRPIRIFFAQGSYKLWRIKSAPKSNWSEFFNLFYLISYMAQIAVVYKEGVELTYYFLTVLPQIHNNLSEDDVLAYKDSFQKLLNLFAKYLPDNIKIKIETDLDVHNRKEYNLLLNEATTSAKRDFYTWPKAKQDDYLRRARLNIKWDGVEDWASLTEEEKNIKVEEAVLYEYAATQVILEKDKENRGVILSTLPREDSIGIGSTSTSIAKHWVGEGVLEEGNGYLHPRILSPSQYEYAKSLKHEVVNVDVVNEDGFSSIEVFPKHFDFSQK